MPGGVGGVAPRGVPLSRLTAAIAVAAPSKMHSVAQQHAHNSIGALAPIGTSITSQNYTSLTDATLPRASFQKPILKSSPGFTAKLTVAAWNPREQPGASLEAALASLGAAMKERFGE